MNSQLITFKTSEGKLHWVDSAVFNTFPDSYFACLTRFQKQAKYELRFDDFTFMLILKFYNSGTWPNIHIYNMNEIVFEKMCDYTLLPAKPIECVDEILEKYNRCCYCRMRTTIFSLMPGDIQEKIVSYLEPTQINHLLCQQCEFMEQIQIRRHITDSTEQIIYDEKDNPFDIIDQVCKNTIDLIDTFYPSMICCNNVRYQKFPGNKIFVWCKLFENDYELLNHLGLIQNNKIDVFEKTVVFEIYYNFESEKTDRIMDFLEILGIVYKKEISDFDETHFNSEKEQDDAWMEFDTQLDIEEEQFVKEAEERFNDELYDKIHYHDHSR